MVQELRFVSDAKTMIEREGGDIVVIGLFGEEQTDELKMFTTVAHSREFGDTGWVVGWSREERVLRHFEVSDGDTPRVLLYRDFDRVGDILEGGARDIIQCASLTVERVPFACSYACSRTGITRRSGKREGMIRHGII